MTKCGFIAVLGAPNAGKSTFVNALVGQKVSIVSEKPHTTRDVIYGVLSVEDDQMIFVDTPGLVTLPQDLLQRSMRRLTYGSSRKADLCMVFMDVTKPYHPATERLLNTCLQHEKPTMLVLTKADLLSSDQLLPIIQHYRPYEDRLIGFFPVSSITKRGLSTIQETIRKHLPESPWLYEAQDITQTSFEFTLSETTREKVFQSLHQEIPYKIYVETEEWHWGTSKDRVTKKKSLFIWQAIFVMKEGHRKLILGHHGQRIRHIGMLARQELSALYGAHVHLFLYVKVDPLWMDKKLPPN